MVLPFLFGSANEGADEGGIEGGRILYVYYSSARTHARTPPPNNGKEVGRTSERTESAS